MRVDIYRNLHKKCWSVRSRDKENYGIVVDHLNKACVIDCTFVVGEKGRQRVLDSRRKNVHAVVRGTLISESGIYLPPLVYKGEVSYNPYVAGHFFTKHNGEPIKKAKLVKFFKDKVLAYD